MTCRSMLATLLLSVWLAVPAAAGAGYGFTHANR
jgi:hypothetical protein